MANKACYFPDQRNLRFFNSYLQENCRRECTWNWFVISLKYFFLSIPLDYRTISFCGCAPRFLHLQGIIFFKFYILNLLDLSNLIYSYRVKNKNICLDVNPCQEEKKNMTCWVEEVERIKLDGLGADYIEKCDCK